MTTDSEIATLEANLSNHGFNRFVSEIRFFLPLLYEQFPPGKPFKEEDVRDFAWALICRPGSDPARESYSKIGRTDLTLTYRSSEDQQEYSSEKNIGERPQSEIVESNFRVEFKIWGREGYKEAPSQPLKYMAESELAAAFIMIDRRAGPNIADFEEIVASNADYPCLSVREIPLVETDLRYFVSFHSDPRYRTPRLVMNFYLPIRE
jgi:hypothetical protein